jgi:hypothetical protein
MATSNDMTVAKMAAVLIPVVVGSLLGLIVSVTTNFVTFQTQQNEMLRKERAAHLERAMTLTAKYSNDLGKLLSIGFITKGDIKEKDLAVMSAPTDTLLELNVVISLHFPELKGDLDQLFVAHGSMMQRYDEIIGRRGQHREEDAATYTQRIQKEIVPIMNRVQVLMKKLTDLAMQKRSDLTYSQHAEYRLQWWTIRSAINQTGYSRSSF